MSNDDFSSVDSLSPVNASLVPTAEGESAVEASTERPPRPEAWGFWFTLLWCLLGAILLILVQTVVAVSFFVVSLVREPHQDLNALIERLETNGLLLSLATCATTVVLPPYFALLVYWLRWPIGEYLGLGRLRIGQTAAVVLLMLLLVALMDGTSLFIGRPIVPPFMEQTYRNAGSLPLLIFALVVAAPVGEEVFFRGFMFRGVAASPAGGYGAIVLTSVCWSLLHLQYDVYGVAQLFLGGLFLGAVRLKTGSTTLTIVLHALLNVIATMETAIHVALLDRGLPGLNW